MQKNHESDDQLELYALDRLSGAEVIRVEEHLFVCEECRERLEQNAAFAFTMQDVLKQHPELSEASKEKGFFEWFGLFRLQFAMAAFAVAVLAAGIFWMSSRTGSLPPVASLQLIAMRGEIQNVAAAKALDLTMTDAPATGGPFRVEMVDAGGSPEWNGSPQPTPSGLKAHIAKKLSAGTYFARLYDASGKLVHEYGVRVISPE
ncbi:MAG: hypothetical protein QOJ99_5366 [Bryobacterales bacterium]|jgi:anti-sigma-K factor RskA|nr:hypothetical protein [Bryobacterales bacterium]